MWKKATIGGLVAVAVAGGTAGVAIASSHTNGTPAATATPSGTAGGQSVRVGEPAPTGSTATGKGAKKNADAAIANQMLGKLTDLQHAEWVSKSGANTYVTHDAILGQVTAVSASSISVKASDGTSLTFAVNDQTKVHPFAAAKAKAGKKSATSTGTSTGTPTASPTSAPASTATIADVTVGQTVLVSGEKAPDLTAKVVFGRS